MKCPTALIAACLLSAAPAHADHGAPLVDARVERGLSIARTYWGVPVPCAHAVLGLPPHAAPGDGWAEQPGCRIWLDADWLRDAHEFYVCGLLVHEYGHLLGHGHSDDPSSPMAPASFPPPVCLRPQPARCKRGWFPVSSKPHRCRHKPRLLR